MLTDYLQPGAASRRRRQTIAEDWVIVGDQKYIDVFETSGYP